MLNFRQYNWRIVLTLISLTLLLILSAMACEKEQEDAPAVCRQYGDNPVNERQSDSFPLRENGSGKDAESGSNPSNGRLIGILRNRHGQPHPGAHAHANQNANAKTHRGAYSDAKCI